MRAWSLMPVRCKAIPIEAYCTAPKNCATFRSPLQKQGHGFSSPVVKAQQAARLFHEIAAFFIPTLRGSMAHQIQPTGLGRWRTLAGRVGALARVRRFLDPVC